MSFVNNESEIRREAKRRFDVMFETITKLSEAKLANKEMQVLEMLAYEVLGHMYFNQGFANDRREFNMDEVNRRIFEVAPNNILEVIREYMESYDNNDFSVHKWGKDHE